LDFTADDRYTLSDATKNILEDLVEPVTVTAYFSEDLPPDIAKVRSDFKDLLVEYSQLSHGMLVYEFINPNEKEEYEQKAMKQGIQPVLINTREKDQSVQKKAYLGAVIQMNESKDIIPFLQPGTAMEYSLSSSIKKISVIDKPVVGFLQGHGEAALSDCNQMLTSLQVMHNVEDVYLSDTTNNLLKYSTVAIVSPKDSFSVFEFQQLDEFLSKGKNLLITFNRVDGDLTNASGSSLNTGLETWLKQKGISVDENFVIDANCANVTVPQRFGNMMLNTQVGFPYIPVINTFPDHPITKGLEAVLAKFISSLSYTGDSTVRFTPILESSKKSGTLSSPLFFDVRNKWIETDFPMSNLTLGAALEGPIVGTIPSKMVVIPDGDLVVNGSGKEMMQLQPDNISLFVNAVDWLSDDTGLIELRTKGITSRPIDQLEDSTKLILKLVNLLIPVLLIIVYGIFRMIRNRNRRIKRMEEGHV
ncbi:MAG: hypothetical protein C0594_15515, partial [Marinilabiliales bacterium]